MKKIIAKTIKGSEYLYSRISCYAVSAAKAEIICKALNDNRYKLTNDTEIWKVYNISEFDIRYTNAVCQKLILRQGKIKTQEYWTVCPGGNW